MGWIKTLAISSGFTAVGLLVYDTAKAALAPSNFGVQLKDIGIKGVSGLQVNLGLDITVDNSTSQEVTISNLNVLLYKREIKNGKTVWSRVGRTAANDRTYPIKPNNRTKINNIKVTVSASRLASEVSEFIQRITGGGNIGQTFKAVVKATIYGKEITQSKEVTL